MADTPRLGSLASLLHGLGALLFNRAELARLEWQEQQERLLLQTLLAGLAVLLLPDFAASLRGLYGAQVATVLHLPAWWWLAGVLVSVLGALLAGVVAVWACAPVLRARPRTAAARTVLICMGSPARGADDGPHRLARIT